MYRFSFVFVRTFSALLLLLWMIVIFSFSALPGDPLSSSPPLWYFLERKIAHVTEYALLTWLSFRFFRYIFVREHWKKILWGAMIFSLAYGTTDELHQFFVPLRGASIRDVLIDGIGVLLAGATIFFWEKMSRSK